MVDETGLKNVLNGIALRLQTELSRHAEELKVELNKLTEAQHAANVSKLAAAYTKVGYGDPVNRALRDYKVILERLATRKEGEGAAKIKG